MNLRSRRDGCRCRQSTVGRLGASTSRGNAAALVRDRLSSEAAATLVGSRLMCGTSAPVFALRGRWISRGVATLCVGLTEDRLSDPPRLRHGCAREPFGDAS